MSPTTNSPICPLAAALALVALSSCATFQPPQPISDPPVAPEVTVEDLYREGHIIELARLLRDMSIHAVSEAAAKDDRQAPDYGPLTFTTHCGLKVTYGVTPEHDGHRHDIAMELPSDGIAVEPALNLLRFTADLLGAVVDEAVRDQGRRYHLLLDLDRDAEITLLENAMAYMSDDDILFIWKQAVLKQVSTEPIVLRDAIPER